MPEIPASAGRSPLRDLHVPRPVKKSKTVYEGRVWDIARESFRLDPADKSQDPLTRELMVHPGAVAILAVLAFLVYRAVTYDDGTRDITAGQCVTASEAGDVRTEDCADASSLGTVVVVQRNAFTDDASVRRLCAEHGSTRALTSALAQGGTEDERIATLEGWPDRIQELE